MNNFVVKSPRRIANKIILLVLALEFFSILLWGSLTYSGSRDELIKSKSSELSEIAFSTTNEIGKFFLPILIEADVIAAAIAADMNKQSDRIPILLYSFIKHRSEIEEVSIVDNQGRETKRVSRMTGVGKSEVRQYNNDPLVENAFWVSKVSAASRSPNTLSRW